MHCKFDYSPKRSTISDANKRRDCIVFEDIYSDLVTEHLPDLSDSHKQLVIEQERAPINHPNRTNHKVQESILKLKNKHMLWDAKKIRSLLFKRYPEELIPSVVTVHNILFKNGLV
ncbi:hypothetical protein [Maribacter antarcticus]|uniref:hypothetical protein n=1 Tax=Maribacter antarcticus TaxID=505250 RepID=UPI0012EB3A98|nr:hypothetical protein [Maribacter antarcticus]